MNDKQFGKIVWASIRKLVVGAFLMPIFKED